MDDTDGLADTEGAKDGLFCRYHEANERRSFKHNVIILHPDRTENDGCDEALGHIDGLALSDG
jgi:hypothetical protein